MRLLAQNGPLAGTMVTLADDLNIGATETGQPICRVRALDGGFVLYALDEQTPVFVNGLPVTTRRLELRDELRLADSIFVVSADDAPLASTLTACSVDEGVARDRKTYLKASFDLTLLSGPPPPAAGTREEHELTMLLRAAAVLSSVRGLAGLDAAVAGLILDAIPVQRVAFADGDDHSATVRSAWTVGNAAMPAFTVDSGRSAQVMRDRAAIVVEMNGANAIVAPMMAFGRAVGAVWAEAAPGTDLDVRHMLLVLAVAALAAVAREQAHETARLEQTQRTSARRDQHRTQHGRREPSDAYALRSHRSRGEDRFDIARPR